MSSAAERPHVLILGAGLGGLTLAQALRKQGVSFEIFERDAGLHSRFQGWAIALHNTLDDFVASMPKDLGDAAVTSHLLPLDRPSQFTLYIDQKEVSRTTSTGERKILRANRNKLRDYLAANIDVKWGKSLSQIEETDEKVMLHFEDGTTATGDVLVGADGVHSKVREYLYGGKDHLKTLPIEAIGGEVTLTREQYERQMDLAKSAYVAVVDNTRRIFVGLNSVDPDAEHAHYYWFWMFRQPGFAQGRFEQHNASKEQRYDFIMKESAALGPQLSEIVRLTKPEGMLSHPPVLRDLELESMPNKRITLLGDSCHAMSPARGEGGNHALQDALNLARALAKAEMGTVLPRLKEYQNEMLERGREAVQNSRRATLDDGSGSAAAFNSWAKKIGASPGIAAH